MEEAVAAIAALLQVMLIDLALSADNAVAVGLAASTLPAGPTRDRALRWGVFVAFLLRIAFGLVAVQLLQIHGLLAIGGAILFWIAIRMWLDLRAAAELAKDVDKPKTERKASFMRALVSIVFANIAFSLDNVLAVAGVARHAFWIMVFGLTLAVLLMGVAASLIARVVERHRGIAYAGLVVIFVAGLAMVWDDAHYFFPGNVVAPPLWLSGGAM